MKPAKLSKKYLKSYKKYCIADLQRSLRRSIDVLINLYRLMTPTESHREPALRRTIR